MLSDTKFLKSYKTNRRVKERKQSLLFFLDVPLLLISEGKAQMVAGFYKVKVLFNQVLNYAMNIFGTLCRKLPWVHYKVTLLA